MNTQGLRAGLLLLCAVACGSDANGDEPASQDAAEETSDKGEGDKAVPSTSKSDSKADMDGPEASDSAADSAQAEAKAEKAEGVAKGEKTDAASAAPAKDECGLKTDYPGDDYCIKPPAADKGWQLHIGPDDYEKVDAKYILQPGEERTDNFDAVSSNDKKVFFYYRQFRMRPGAHHNIITASSGDKPETSRADTGGRRIGTTNHLIEDNPKGGVIAPENQGVGVPLEPHSKIGVSLHSINTTDKPLLRELWVNFWYRPESEVTEPVVEMFQTGDVSFQIQPREDKVLGPYRCTIEGEGRMLWFYGHRHANNVRFSAWRVRGDQRELFYEGYNWEEPMVLEYSSTVKNTVPKPEQMIEGGFSGVLDMKPGDVLEWECHVVNRTDGVLRFSNNTFTGEMCIMDAELVGANCPAGFGR